MRLLTQIRALFVLVMLATHSPLGIAIERNAAAPVPKGSLLRIGFLGISTFTGRFTRLEAALQFDPTKAAAPRCPSRYVRRSIAGQG